MHTILFVPLGCPCSVASFVPFKQYQDGKLSYKLEHVLRQWAFQFDVSVCMQAFLWIVHLHSNGVDNMVSLWFVHISWPTSFCTYSFLSFFTYSNFWYFLRIIIIGLGIFYFPPYTFSMVAHRKHTCATKIKLFLFSHRHLLLISSQWVVLCSLFLQEDFIHSVNF